MLPLTHSLYTLSYSITSISCTTPGAIKYLHTSIKHRYTISSSTTLLPLFYHSSTTILPLSFHLLPLLPLFYLFYRLLSLCYRSYTTFHHSTTSQPHHHLHTTSRSPPYLRYCILTDHQDLTSNPPLHHTNCQLTIPPYYLPTRYSTATTTTSYTHYTTTYSYYRLCNKRRRTSAGR